MILAEHLDSIGNGGEQDGVAIEPTNSLLGDVLRRKTLGLKECVDTVAVVVLEAFDVNCACCTNSRIGALQWSTVLVGAEVELSAGGIARISFVRHRAALGEVWERLGIDEWAEEWDLLQHSAKTLSVFH